MSLAALSVAALAVAILVSCFVRLNVGLLAIILAWIVGVFFGGMKLEQVLSGFPVSLFVTLMGVTLLFAQAQTNGTLDRLAHSAVGLCRGRAGLIPVMFFLFAAALASIGPGNIATAALLAPMAMAAAGRAKIPAFLMAIMVGNGANAGSLSPFAPTGIIVNGLMSRIGLLGMEWQTYVYNLAAHTMVAFSGYFLLGGWKLFRDSYQEPCADENSKPFAVGNWLTLGAIFLVIVAVIGMKVNVGMAALTAALVLSLLRVADDGEAVRRMPWNVIVMVSGVTVLIGLLEKTQGLALFTDLLARISTRETVTASIAFVTGLISTYSSTSGVVLPAFLPTIPGLIERLGGGSAIAIASSMNVGSHLVDVSPLSTIGALCIAAAPPAEDTRRLFQKMLSWGFAMIGVGAGACYLFFSRM